MFNSTDKNCLGLFWAYSIIFLLYIILKGRFYVEDIQNQSKYILNQIELSSDDNLLDGYNKRLIVTRKKVLIGNV